MRPMLLSAHRDVISRVMCYIEKSNQFLLAKVHFQLNSSNLIFRDSGKFSKKKRLLVSTVLHFATILSLFVTKKKKGIVTRLDWPLQVPKG